MHLVSDQSKNYSYRCNLYLIMSKVCSNKMFMIYDTIYLHSKPTLDSLNSSLLHFKYFLNLKLHQHCTQSRVIIGREEFQTESSFRPKRKQLLCLLLLNLFLGCPQSGFIFYAFSVVSVLLSFGHSYPLDQLLLNSY